MRKYQTIRNIFLICSAVCSIPSIVIGGWQVAKPNSALPRDPFFQTRSVPPPQHHYSRTDYKNADSNRATIMHSTQPRRISPGYTPHFSSARRHSTLAGARPIAPLIAPTIPPSALGGMPAYPVRYLSMGPAAPMYAMSISGSVKENLERILKRYDWKVVWKAPFDYNFDGRVSASTLPKTIEKLLDPFPLQAVMYTSNRTVAIVPRIRP